MKYIQQSYGDDFDLMQELVDNQIVPEHAIDYRDLFMASFDIETIETKIDQCPPEHGMIKEANLQLLSIAIGSNAENYSPKCWIRKSSDKKEEERLVKAFVDELIKLSEIKKSRLPSWINEGLEKLSDITHKLKQRKAKFFEYQAISRLERALKQFKKLSIFGFNSSKFDLPCIIGPLMNELTKRTSDIKVLKKMSSYFMISTKEFVFKDVLRFTAPCSYDKFLTVWESPFSKSIWPYSHYHSVEEIRSDKQFPPIQAFASSLRGYQKPEMKIYIAAKREFYRRKLLPKNHLDRIVSMYGFLRYYNLMDVQPLILAIENCFNCYYEYFGVDAMKALSLPSLAQTAMFKNFDKQSPLIVSFDTKNGGSQQLFRKFVTGGLVNAFLRHVQTFDSESENYTLPKEARYAPNNEPYTSIVSLDFTSMYLTTQKQNLPTSPGILFTLRDKFYVKNVMCQGHSFKCQQWLTWLQATGNIYIHI